MNNTLRCVAALFVLMFLIGPTTAHTPFQQLEEDVNAVSYSIGEYVNDRFDCSNMAGLMVDELDTKGYNAEMVLVHSKLDKNCRHTFVIVDREVIIEPTRKLITFAEGRYGNYNSIDWYVATWNIIGVYTDKEAAAKYSQWGIVEFNTIYRDLK